jgi:hypothetical protein
MMKNSYFHLALLIGLLCIVLPASAMTWYVDDGGEADFPRHSVRQSTRFVG